MFAVLLLAVAAAVSGQEVRDCPKGWYEYSGSCYRFLRSPLRQRNDALTACQTLYNAVLLSVNTMEEHAFVMSWLRQNDPQHRIWYTSGIDVGQNIWRWQGDDTPFVNMEQAWLPTDYFGGSPAYTFSAYNYSEVASQWGLLRVTGMEEAPFICEIPKMLLQVVISEERGYDYGIVVSDPRRIPRAPYFVQQPENAVYDISGSSEKNFISLRCIASGFPYPTYEWFKEEYIDDRYVPKRIDPMSDPRLTQTDGILTIYKPDQFIDRGKYHCRAANMYGTVLSESVDLTFGFITQFNLRRQDESGKETWGKAIYCDPPQFYPRVSFYWLRESMPNFVDEDRRVFVSQDGYLYFTSLETIDQGTYACIVQSSVSSLGRTGPFFHLEVKPHSSNQQLQFPNNFPKVFPEAPVAGEDVRLECIAFGYPVPRYNWTRKGVSATLPKASSTTSYNRVLIIPKVAIEDMGDYICTASNGKDSITASVKLSIQAKPVFTIPLDDMHADKGADLTWNCEAFGIPQVQYEWLRNADPLMRNLPPEDRPRYIVRENILTIRNLDPARDGGVYQCRAENQLGVTYSSGELRVLTLKPSFFKYPLEPETYATENGNATLRCRPEGAPLPQFQWRRNGSPLPSDGRIQQLRNGQLIINRVSRSDEGHYSCRAHNEFGSAESEGVLKVLSRPSFVRQPPPRVLATLNDTLRLECAVYSPSQLDLAYLWKFNGIRIEDTVNSKVRFLRHDSDPGSLIVVNISYYDTGAYECVARTPIDSVSTKTQLDVQGPPGKPGGIQTLATTGRSVRLQWTDGPSYGQTIRAFDVEARTHWNLTWVPLLRDIPAQMINPSLQRREAVIDGNILSPWSMYEFRVIPKNVFGVGEPSDPSPAHNTKEDRPFKFPDNIGGGGGNVGDLTIRWTPLPLQDQNAPGVWYKVFYKPADTESDYRFEEMRDEGNIGIKVVRVGERNYFRQYRVRVQAYNSKGAGPISPESTVVYSAEDRPNAVPTQVGCRSFNSTALNVSWQPIEMTRENIRGHLIGFRIKSWPKQDNPDDATYHLSRLPFQSWAIIVGLQPDTYYSVVVMAFNGAGSGTESEPYIERTFKSAPLKPPTSVMVKVLSATSVQVTWRSAAPSQVEEPLLGFKVRYWEADQDFSTYTDVYVPLGGDLIAEVHGLAPGKVYKLRVLAYSQGGDGRQSSPAWEFQLGSAEFLRGASNSLSLSSVVLLGIVLSLSRVFIS